MLIGGAFSFGGQTYAFPDPFRANIWQPPGICSAWMEYLHGFSWLRDIRAVGTADAARAAFTLVENWCRFKTSPAVPGLIGKRLAHWISQADFFLPENHEPFRDLFFAQIDRQAAMLHKSLNDASGVDGFAAARGLLYAGLALEGRELWIEAALTTLDGLMGREILKDGGHISRSPAALFDILTLLIDTRAALMAGGYPTPEAVDKAIERAAEAVRFFRLAGGGLASFHGGVSPLPSVIDQALNLAALEGKIFQTLPQSGFERMAQGRSLVIFDAGAAAPASHDRAAHAAPLAFEFWHGKDVVFGACGNHPLSAEWQDFLRGTAAHTALTLDSRNACEIRETGAFGRRNRRTETRRMDTKTYLLAEGLHDGYESLNGLIHRRRLYLGDKGHDLRGEERLSCTIGKPLQPSRFDIRFHLHPRAVVSLIQGGTAALLRLPGGSGWRFHHEGGQLAVEESVWVEGDQPPRKTTQLVISGAVSEAETLLKWALQREGV